MITNFQRDFVFLKPKLNWTRPDITYKFTFTSLISPYLVSDLRIYNVSSSPSTPKKSTILLKQSYLLFTWFYYLKEAKVGSSGSKPMIKFAFLPTRRTMYTLTKAPMAHKTNSKEQFVFRVFKFKTSIKTRFIRGRGPNSVDQSLLSLFLTNSMFPIFETNLLLLKHYTFILKMRDHRFFNYYSFTREFRKLTK